VILLAEHDEPSLAAKKKQRHVALKTATSTPKNRVWNFFGSAPGRISCEPASTPETATGSVQFSYETASGQAYYYTRDHLHSVREITNSSGTVLSRYGYDPYGQITVTHTAANTSTPPIDATFAFDNYLWHQPSGLYLPWWRPYDSKTGRWPSYDPLGLKGSLNLYNFDDNDPTNEIDPFGLSTIVPVPCSAEEIAAAEAECLAERKTLGAYECTMEIVTREGFMFSSETYSYHISYQCLSCADAVTKRVRDAWDKVRKGGKPPDDIPKSEYEQAARGYRDAAKQNPGKDQTTNNQRADWAQKQAQNAKH
jgi:RHS repeat-associated protein